MPSQQQAQFKILDICELTPPPESPLPILPFTFYDIMSLHAGAIENVFFYPFPCSSSHFTSTVLANLKSSLSQALNVFYPFYGKVRRSPDNVDKFELSYVDGDSVPFIVAQMDGEDFEELSGCHARDVKRLLPLHPKLIVESIDDPKPALGIQVTLFPNQGFTVGTAMNHAACDGHAFVHFLSTWASICRNGGPSPMPPPLFDRAIIPDSHGLYNVFLENWRSIHNNAENGTQNGLYSVSHKNQDNGGFSSETTVSQTFTLSAAQIHKLKEAVRVKTNEDTAFHCSTIVVTYAFLWVCMVKTRRFASDQRAYLWFAANCSKDHQPPIPPTYFGNRIGVIHLDANVGELVQKDGFIVAAKVVGKGIHDFKRNVFGGANKWMEKWNTLMSGKQPFSVAGSPHLRLYDIDFGWGKPKKSEITTVKATGGMTIAESTREQNGVEIGLILPKPDMDEFAAQFSNGLQMLSSVENDV